MSRSGQAAAAAFEARQGGTRRRRRVLVVVGTYLPGVKGGGPIRSIAALADQLQGHLEVLVVCRDRDAGDKRPYPGVVHGKWVSCGAAAVLYLRPWQFSPLRYRRLLRSCEPDVIYLNTVFSVRETILPAAVTLATRPATKIVLAPRGCLDPGPLALKAWKKRLFLRLFRLSKLPQRMTWQATTEQEARVIRAGVGEVTLVVAANLTSTAPVPFMRLQRARKEPGALRLVFLSRIVRNKNLLFLAEQLRLVCGQIELTVAGPIEDRRYWKLCSAALGHLEHVRVQQIGTVPHEQVPDLLAAHHVLALPSLGENFGHVILEALGAGIGVLISDRTPWRGLRATGAGWDLPLDDPSAWVHALQVCCNMDDRQFQAMSKAAVSMHARVLDVEAIRRANRSLFGVVTVGEGREGSWTSPSRTEGPDEDHR